MRRKADLPVHGILAASRVGSRT